VRGIYPSEINEKGACLIAKALVKFLKAKSIVAARDMRPSSEPLYQAVLKGLKEIGVKIFDVGLSTTPMHTFVINLENADGGVMITASHNPAEYNGFKIKMPSGGAAPVEVTKEIENLLDENTAAENSEKAVPIEKMDLTKPYVKFIRSYIDLKMIKNKRPRLVLMTFGAYTIFI